MWPNFFTDQNNRKYPFITFWKDNPIITIWKSLYIFLV